jgi:putative ABC transport system permease protein
MSKRDRFDQSKRINPWEIVTMGLSSLASNKLRSSLTMFGIAIGVFSVVSVMTALSAMRSSIDKNLEVFSGEVFHVSRMPTIQINDGWWNYRDRPRFDYRQATRFKILMESNTESLVCLQMGQGGQIARYKDRKSDRNIRVTGTNENFLDCFAMNVEFGRNLVPEDVENGRTVAVVGVEIVKKLFPFEDPLGKQMTVLGTKYTIVGVMEEKGQGFGQNPDRTVLVPLTRFLSTKAGQWIDVNIAVKGPSIEEMAEYQDHAIGYLRTVRGLEAENPNNFEVTSNDAVKEIFEGIANWVSNGGLIISAIALAVAGVGVMNIMLVSVTERTREIGIRKSIGARKKDILKQFLLEAVFLCEVGGVMGIILGIIGGNIIAALSNSSVIFPWFWTVVAIATCSLIGIVFGMYPAYKAASLHPIDALRFE